MTRKGHEHLRSLKSSMLAKTIPQAGWHEVRLAVCSCADQAHGVMHKDQDTSRGLTEEHANYTNGQDAQYMGLCCPEQVAGAPASSQ